jgi:hypothetical protein
MPGLASQPNISGVVPLHCPSPIPVSIALSSPAAPIAFNPQLFALALGPKLGFGKSIYPI